MTTSRIQPSNALKSAYRQLILLHQTVEQEAIEAGLDHRLIELVKTRASQINGCAHCTDMHSRGARKHGETERRLYLLPVWWETDLYTEQERAALTLTEAMTTLSENQEVSDEVYELATEVLTERQYTAVAWAATVINAFNRLAVTGHAPLTEEAT